MARRAGLKPMSLEYAIEYHCEMRRQYDEPTLRAFGRAGALVSRLVADAVENDRVPSEESVRFATMLAADIERGESVADYCRLHCAACLSAPLSADAARAAREGGALQSVAAEEREPIGCLGRINYPVEARFERFLADRVQLLYDTVDEGEWPHLLHVLLDADSPFDGEATKELRRVTTDDGLRFFEMRVPVALARRAVRLTTNNLFDSLAGFSASDGGASGYSRELPVIALPDYAEFLEALLIYDLSDGERERLSAGKSYRQYVRFAQAVRRAADLNVRLLID
jgi:hypothetical protein